MFVIDDFDEAKLLIETVHAKFQGAGCYKPE